MGCEDAAIITSTNYLHALVVFLWDNSETYYIVIYFHPNDERGTARLLETSLLMRNAPIKMCTYTSRWKSLCHFHYMVCWISKAYRLESSINEAG